LKLFCCLSVLPPLSPAHSTPHTLTHFLHLHTSCIRFARHLDNLLNQAGGHQQRTWATWRIFHFTPSCERRRRKPGAISKTKSRIIGLRQQARPRAIEKSSTRKREEETESARAICCVEKIAHVYRRHVSAMTSHLRASAACTESASSTSGGHRLLWKVKKCCNQSEEGVNVRRPSAEK